MSTTRTTLAVTAAALGAFGLADPLRAQSTTCAPGDQLECACTAAGLPSILDRELNPCFLGDVNTITSNQADGFTLDIFTAINFPVKIDDNGKAVAGVPDYTADLKGPWTSVWETWKSTNHILTETPVPWDQLDYPLPQACARIDVAAAMAAVPYADRIPNVIQPRLLDEHFNNPEGHALLDRNGVPVRYDVIFNRQAYDYTVSNGLTTSEGIKTFLAANGKLSMPQGFWNPAARGAIVLKTSWMVLDNAHDPANFHAAWAYVTPVIENGEIKDDCALEPVGLVGMHVVYKTDQFYEWGWGTFEHVRSAPEWTDLASVYAETPGSGKASDAWLFFSPQGATAQPLNQPPASATAQTPSRIVDLYPAGYYRVAIGDVSNCGPNNQNIPCQNARLQETFKKMSSPLANYGLKGTQWADNAGGGGRLIPEIMANVTMETYTQATSNCQSCHSYARPTGAALGTLDFMLSFKYDVLERSAPAQPAPAE